MNIIESLRNFFLPCKHFTQLYDNILATEKQQYYSHLGSNTPVDINEVMVDFSGVYNEDRCTYFYMITEYPRELGLNWKRKLRGYCKGSTRLSFINICKQHTINWESTEMRNRLRILGEISKDNMEKDINAFNMHKNISSVRQQEWVEESLVYLAEASKERGCGFYKTSILLIVSGVRGEDFDTSIRDIEDEAKNILGFKLQRVLYNIPSILGVYSPFSQFTVDDVEHHLPWKVLTDEIIARYNVYTQGIVGAEGVYVGTDVYSKFPVLKIFKQSATDAENMLITAETGGGKSYLIKMILLQLVALGYYGTIMDIEGDEYTPIANLLSKHSKVYIVNMAEGLGKYFDPVEIPKQLGDVEIDSMGFNMSSNFTKQIFCILLGDLLKEDSWYTILIDEAVATTYKQAGVYVGDVSTWKNSSNLRLHNVYETLKAMLGTYKADNKIVQAAIDKALTKLGVYFEADGIKSYIFQNRIHISEVAGAELVICSFGMKGKSENSVDPIQMSLMQLSAAMFSHQRSLYSKAQGKFNFKVWEEFQRWGDFEGSDKTLGVAITGGRKLGDINIIISNRVKALLDNDRFGILDNLQSLFVGCIPDSSVRHELLLRKDLLQFETELGRIAMESSKKQIAGVTKNKTHTSESIYRHAFLVSLDNASRSIVKMQIPPKLSESALFKTGVDTEKKKDNLAEIVHQHTEEPKTSIYKEVAVQQAVEFTATQLLDDYATMEEVVDEDKT